MSIDQLRAFLALTETRHFARAAARLHVTQPALTKRIQALETAWGGPLFDRARDGAHLTPLGDLLLPDAARVVAGVDALRARARDAAKGDWGRLDVGFGLSTADLAPHLVAAYRARHPNVEVTLNDHASADQVDRLLSGRLDVGFVRLPVDGALASRPLLEERLALASAANGPALGDGDIDALKERGFVTLARHRGPGLADQVSRWCEGAGFTPRVVQTADDIQTVLALVAAGVGHGLLPSRAGRLAAGAVRLTPLPGDDARWHVGAAWREGRRHAALSNFLALVRKHPGLTGASGATRDRANPIDSRPTPW